MLFSWNMYLSNKNISALKLRYECTIAFRSSLLQSFCSHNTKKPLLPRGNTDSVWMFSSIASHCFSFLAKSFLFQLKLISNRLMVRFPKHISTLIREETTGQLLLVGPLALRGGAAPFDSLPSSLLHSEEDVGLGMWQQWQAYPSHSPAQCLGFEKLSKILTNGPWTALGPLLRSLSLSTSIKRRTPFLSISYILWLLYFHVFLHKREHTTHPIPTLLLS